MIPKRQTILVTILIAASYTLVFTSSMIATMLAAGLVLALWKIWVVKQTEKERKRYTKITYTVAVGNMGIEIYPVPTGWDIAQYTIEYQIIPIETQQVKTGEQGNTIVSWEKKGERKKQKEKTYKRLNSTTLERDEVKKLIKMLVNSDEIGIQNAQQVVKAIATSRQKTKIQKLIKWIVSKLFVLKTGQKPLPYPTEIGKTNEKDEKQAIVNKKTS